MQCCARDFAKKKGYFSDAIWTLTVKSAAILINTNKKARNPCKIAGFKMVLRTGLEPVSLSAYAPQTYVSTNFTT